MRIAWRTVGWICSRVTDEVTATRDLFAGLKRIRIDEISTAALSPGAGLPGSPGAGLAGSPDAGVTGRFMPPRLEVAGIVGRRRVSSARTRLEEQTRAYRTVRSVMWALASSDRPGSMRPATSEAG
jgi:hypothetical protein